MALNGTIRDFGLGDIFQLIGIQRKTGILTLESGEDRVTVKFLEGAVVGADTRTRSVEDLLGAVLVRTGRLTEDQLREALRMQKSTLRRLGHVLVRANFISEDDLVEALRVQSLQIVYRLFRWQDGKYSFQATDNLEYDEKHFNPISAETILMEGARMIDEWPIIERRIRSDQMVLRQTAAAAALSLAPTSLVDSSVDVELDFAFEGSAAGRLAGPAQDEPISLTPEEREVLVLVDGQRNVEEITDRCSLGEFDTHRILADLLTRNLVEEVRQGVPEVGLGWRARLADRAQRAVAHSLVFGLVAVSLYTIGSNPLTPWRLAAGDPATVQLRYYASQARLERIDRAIQVFFLDAGAAPDGLERLVREGYLGDADLADPWGRPYVFEVSSDGYRVHGTDAAGAGDPELSLFHRFSSVDRMILLGTGRSG